MSEPVDVHKVLSVNQLSLEDELASCPGLYHMFATLAIDAELMHSKAELALENHELELANKFKKLDPARTKQDKLTETEIKRMYRGDEKWTRLKEEERKCYANYKKLEKAAKAVEMKNQSCMSINKRQLFKAGRGMEDI